MRTVTRKFFHIFNFQAVKSNLLITWNAKAVIAEIILWTLLVGLALGSLKTSLCIITANVIS